MRSRTASASVVALALLAGLVASHAVAQEPPPSPPSQDEPPPRPEPAAAPDGGPAAATTERPAALVIETDLARAAARAKTESRTLVVLAEPGWYDDPAAAKLDALLDGDAARTRLASTVLVRQVETTEREVHVRHRLRDRGYPLAVVLAADGTFLGSVSGLDAATWLDSVLAVPARHARSVELRERLRTAPDDAAALLELAKLYLAGEEADRADALLERLESADRDDTSGLLGEARYLRLRMSVARALLARQFADVEAICLKWLRRFDTAPQAPDVLLLQANGRFLNGDRDGASELWTRLVEKHAATDAGRAAKAALDAL